MNHTFKVQWDEQAKGASNPNRKSTLVQAANMVEAKGKVRARLSPWLKISNMVAFRIS